MASGILRAFFRFERGFELRGSPQQRVDADPAFAVVFQRRAAVQQKAARFIGVNRIAQIDAGQNGVVRQRQFARHLAAQQISGTLHGAGINAVVGFQQGFFEQAEQVTQTAHLASDFSVTSPPQRPRRIPSRASD